MLKPVQENPPGWMIYFPGRWDAERHALELFGYVETNYPLRTKLHWDQGDAWRVGPAVIHPR